MLVNQRARDPWSIEIKRDLPEQVFQHMRDAIKGSSAAFGVSIQTHELKFINRNRLLRDLLILCGMPSSEISAKLQKSLVEVNGNDLQQKFWFGAQSLLLSHNYDKKKCKITLTCRYGCWNNFDYGIHE